MCAESIICPYLKGSEEGAVCKIVNNFIRSIHRADIRLCLSEYFGSCHVYNHYKEDHVEL